MPDPIAWDYALTNSTEGRLLEGIVNRLKVTDLPCIPPERIVLQSMAWVPDETQFPPPFVIVSPAPEGTPWQDATNERDDTLFAAFITVVLANARETTRGMGLQLYWRERIRRKFQNLNILRFTELGELDTGVNFLHGWIESGDKFMEAAKRDQRDAQYYLCRFRVREPRE